MLSEVFEGVPLPSLNFLTDYCYNPVKFRDLLLRCKYSSARLAMDHLPWLSTMDYSLETAVWGIQRFFSLSRRESDDGDSHWAAEAEVRGSEGLSSLDKCTYLTANKPDF